VLRSHSGAISSNYPRSLGIVKMVALGALRDDVGYLSREMTL